jgi:malate synthase
MPERIERNGLRVDAQLARFIEDEALPGTGVSREVFWAGFSALVHDLGPKNRALLATREGMQCEIDSWHRARPGKPVDVAEYRDFLTEIGYLLPEGPDFTLETSGTDPEIATLAGPQLVVPILNARYALNAANARWGSLYDALYGTDALGDLPGGTGYDAARGARVVARAKAHLDQVVPLNGGTWATVTSIAVRDGALALAGAAGQLTLADPAQFVGYRVAPSEVILCRHGLHLRLVLDAATPVGASDPAGISDLILESALSTIMDCEDSVAAVDAEDKVQAYRNWLGLMRGDLTETVQKGGARFTRALNADLDYLTPAGASAQLKGRALMLVRNVGHLMSTRIVTDRDGLEAGEGLVDAMVTTLGAMRDLAKTAGPRNSETGAIYVVKPKMHGPEEVAFADEIFSRVEAVLGLPQDTVKLGIMDEERRTSANLKECIRAARRRVAFINTGFLDRTGDEIHTGMEAGPMLRKAAMKDMPWISAYEDRNVDIGLACGLAGRAQIGKGMWAAPDQMAAMLAQKSAHPLAGANCAWVPSPTAATLHATHYHMINVARRQAEIAAARRPARLDDLLTLPVAAAGQYSAEEIAEEVANNAQGILGYVVRWVDQGVGCSKVPDIHDVGLMEDRATCRISSQALANWLHHGLISEGQMMDIMRKMARVVDAQNAADPVYRPMAPEYSGLAFQAACELVFMGRVQPSGYTEPVLQQRRLQVKAGR